MTELALGTYRCRNVAAAAHIAIQGGTALIDTAPVYNHGYSQRALAPVLTKHPHVRISTKIGYVTTGQAAQASRAGVLPPEDKAEHHSLHPAYIAHQLRANHAELNRERLDLVYLHNPEHHYSDRRALHRRIRDAFTELESAVCAGNIGGYGIATWNGFTDGAFTVAELAQCARQAAGSATNGLRAVQLPASLVRIDTIHQAAKGIGAIIEAHEAGWEVWASAPLHGGELVNLVNRSLLQLISPDHTPAQAALRVVAATPGLHGILVSTSDPQHWAQAAHAVIQPPLPTQHLREICTVLRAR